MYMHEQVLLHDIEGEHEALVVSLVLRSRREWLAQDPGGFRL